MKAEIRIASTATDKEKYYPFDVKNIFGLVKLYYRAKKMKAKAVYLFF